jgi:hypothetical protein
VYRTTQVMVVHSLNLAIRVVGCSLLIVLCSVGYAVAEYPEWQESLTLWTYPNGYDKLYLVLTSPNNARSLALGNGLIGITDGDHTDAWSNPAFAALAKGTFISASTYSELVHWDQMQFRSSQFASSYELLDDKFDQAKLQNVSLGVVIADRVGLQFNRASNYVVDSSALYSIVEDSIYSLPCHERLAMDVYSFTAAVRLTAWASVGFSGRYYRSENIWRVWYGELDDGSTSGNSYDVGCYIRDVLPRLTLRQKLRGGKHFYDRFATDRKGGLSAGAVLRDLGSTTPFYSPRWDVVELDYGHVSLRNYRAELPTTFRLSASYLILQGNELCLELLAGVSQNYRGPYEESLWDLGHSDYAVASEITVCNLVRGRLSYYRLDMNRSNAWGLSVGPPWCQLAYGQTRDLGLLTDGKAAPEDMRSIVSFNLNTPLP